MNKNFCVIMAGGVGSRFWPYSRINKPKQFLDFLGTGKSLLQMTFDRFSQIIPTENILIVSNVQYKELILEQLPCISESQVLLEPARRNTAPCIAYAVYRIKAMHASANIIVAPSDHLILNETVFLQVMKTGLDFVEKNDNLLTIGISPARPETGYGYIEIDNEDSKLCKVKRFTEKPTLDKAKEFLASGHFYWNAGIFLWSLRSINHALNTYLPEMSALFDQGKEFFNTDSEQEFIDRIFPSCENISIDYGIMEKAPNVYVQGAEFGWSDLGTWDSLYGISEKDDHGNVNVGCESLQYDSEDNLVVLPTGKLAVIDGLSGFLIAESDNVLMICPKDAESKIRDFVNDANEKFNGRYN